MENNFEQQKFVLTKSWIFCWQFDWTNIWKVILIQSTKHDLDYFVMPFIASISPLWLKVLHFSLNCKKANKQQTAIIKFSARIFFFLIYGFSKHNESYPILQIFSFLRLQLKFLRHFEKKIILTIYFRQLFFFLAINAWIKNNIFEGHIMWLVSCEFMKMCKKTCLVVDFTKFCAPSKKVSVHHIWWKKHHY